MNVLTCFMINFLICLMNACFSVKHVKKKQRGISKPWITTGILKSNHIKHRLYKESHIKKSVDAIYKYEAYKNKFTKIIKLSQHQYYVNRFENFKCNVQHTWREIKNILYEGRKYQILLKLILMVVSKKT